MQIMFCFQIVLQMINGYHLLSMITNEDNHSNITKNLYQLTAFYTNASDHTARSVVKLKPNVVHTLDQILIIIALF